MAEFGGLAKQMPWYAAVFVIVTMSSIGLPGTNGFIGEFLIITGTFTSTLLNWSHHCQGSGAERMCDNSQIGPLFALLAVSGVVLGAVYMLDVVQKVFFGPSTNPRNKHLDDLNEREWTALAPLIAAIFLVGLFPMYFRDRIDPSVRSFLAVYSAKKDALMAHRGDEAPFMLDQPRRVTPAASPVAPPDRAGTLKP